MDSFWVQKKAYLSARLHGKWRWIRTGSNWGASNSPKKCACERYVFFDQQQIVFQEQNGSQSIFTFDWIRDDYLQQSDYAVIEICETGARWRLDVFDKIKNTYYLLERSENARHFLGILFDPDCACGCPEQHFEKME